MKQLKNFKKSHADYTKKKIELIFSLQKKCQDRGIGEGNTMISRKMGKSDSYVTNMLFKKPYISDETLIAIAETIEIIERGEG